MKLKTISISTAVLLAAAILGWMLNQRGGAPPAQGRAGQVMLDPALFQQSATLRFDSGGDKATLRATDQSWVVEESYDFPVQREFLSQFIFKLSEIKYERLVTRDPAVFPELGVMTTAENGGKAEEKKTGVEFQMLDDKGQSLFHVVFGNRRGGEAGGQVTGAGGMYVRDLDEGTVYLLSGAPRVIVKATDWIQVVILELDEKKDIQRFAIQQPGLGKRVFTRVGVPPEKEDTDTKVEWTIEPMQLGRKISHRAIGEVAKGLGDLFMVNVAPPGLTAEQMGRTQLSTVEIDLFDGRRFQITMGVKADKEGQRYMTIEASLVPGTTDEAVRKQVDEYNRQFKGRIFIVHGWEADRILPSKDGVYEEA